MFCGMDHLPYVYNQKVSEFKNHIYYMGCSGNQNTLQQSSNSIAVPGSHHPGHRHIGPYFYGGLHSFWLSKCVVLVEGITLAAT